MLQPILLIGLGGSGANVLRAIKIELERRLVNSGICAEIPQSWQFLNIDSHSAPDGISFPAPMLSAGEFQTIAPAGRHFETVMQILSGSGTTNDSRSLLGGWGPHVSPIKINRSPNADRASGRAVGLVEIDGIRNAITRAISKAVQPESINQLQKYAISNSNVEIVSQPIVMIISSSGGRTGSGVVIDVQEVLRLALPDIWSQGLVTFLFTEEAFQNLPKGMLRDFTMNTYGLLNELSARTNGVMTHRSTSAYMKKGLIPNNESISRINEVEQNILIRGSNGEMHANFLSFGEELAASICEDKILDFVKHMKKLQIEADKANDERKINPQGMANWEELNFNSKLNHQTALWKNNFVNQRIEDLISVHRSSPVVETKVSTEKKILGSFDHYVVLNNESPKPHRQYFNASQWRYLTSGRRSRPLEESIPLSNELRRSMVTGWLVASILGLREIDNAVDHRIVKIWNTTSLPHQWNEFPNPLVSAHPNDFKITGWVLPQLLLSIGFVLSESATSGVQDSTHPYRFLKFLGREVTTSIPGRDEWDGQGLGDLLPTGLRDRSTLIFNWVSTGTPPSQDREMGSALLDKTSKFRSRRDALIELVREMQSRYAQIWSEMSDAEWQDLPETWELQDDINLALGDIVDYVSKIK